MITLKFTLEGVTPFKREQAISFVNAANDFTSHIIVEHQNRTINGKSLLGILSLGNVESDALRMTIEGEDEREAADAITQLLQKTIGGKICA